MLLQQTQYIQHIMFSQFICPTSVSVLSPYLLILQIIRDFPTDISSPLLIMCLPIDCWYQSSNHSKLNNLTLSFQTRKRGSDYYSLHLRYEARIASQYSDSLHTWGSRVQKPVWAKFSVPVQTGPKAHSTSCTMVLGLFPRDNWPVHGIGHLSFSSTKFVYG